MQALVDFLVAHGHLVVFLWIAADQAGVPIPGVPLLLAAGALAGAGHLNLPLLAVLAIFGSLLSDVVWFAIGRRHGIRVLRFLCRISLEPDSCVRRTENTFASRGAWTLVVAKFVPGLATAAPPLAGLTGMRLGTFLGYSTIGATVWSLAFLLPGYLCSDQLERLAGDAALTGTWLLGIFAGVVVLWITFRFAQRQRFLRKLRIAPDDLYRLQQDGADVFVVDLRHAVDFDADPHTVPGALRLTAEEIESRHVEIPRDRDVVLYCT
jgi:membrane protein DedA with SNARE-associated domain